MVYWLKKVGAADYISQDVSLNRLPFGAFGWDISETIEEGSTINFTIHGETDESELIPGGFYQLIAEKYPGKAFFAFELFYAKKVWKTPHLSVYECTGKSYRSFLSERAYLKFRSNKITFKDLCKLFLRKLNRRHYAFSLDDTYIEDVDFTFNDYYFWNYGQVFLDDMTDRGYRLYFDQDLKLHANKETITTQIYNVVDQLDDYSYQLDSVADLRVGDRIVLYPAQKAANIVYIVKNFSNLITVSNLLNNSDCLLSLYEKTTMTNYNLSLEKTSALLSVRYANGFQETEFLLLSFASSYSQTIGNGIDSSYTVVHGLNTRDLYVQVFEVSTGQIVNCGVERSSANSVSISFSQVAQMVQYRVNIVTAPGYVASYTDGLLIKDIVHGLNTNYVNAVVYDTDTNEEIFPSIGRVDLNTVRLAFTAPHNYRVCIFEADYAYQINKTNLNVVVSSAPSSFVSFINRTNELILDLDGGYKIQDADENNQSKVNFNLQERPTDQFLIKAENVVSTDFYVQSFNSDGRTGLSYSLEYSPASPDRAFVTFDPDSEHLLSPESIAGSDVVDLGLLLVNPLSGHTLVGNTQYRNYDPSINAREGLSVGVSFTVQQTTGKISFMTLQPSPSDAIDKHLIGFVMDGLYLKILYNGTIENSSFGQLVPRLEREVSSITGKTLHLTDASGYREGETVIFRINDEIKDEVFAVIQTVVGNDIILDTAINFTAGMKVIQQADYLVKYSYSRGKVQYWAKRGTDQDFALLATKDIILTAEEMFVRFYTNEEHSLSFDFVDITDNVTFNLVRRGNQQEPDRVIDIAFEEQAAELQSEAQLVEEDATWKLKFSADENEILVKPIQEVINDFQFRLLDTEGIAVGDRALLLGSLAFIDFIDISLNVITLDRAVQGVNVLNNDAIMITDVLPSDGETLELTYKVSKTETILLCDESYIDPSHKGLTKIDLSDTMKTGGDSVAYGDFRVFAQAEVDRYLTPTIEGSYKAIVENAQFGTNEYMIGHDEIPYSGQEVRIYSPNKFPDLHEAKGLISGVNLREINDYMFEIELTVGSPYTFATLVSRLMKGAQKVARLIDEDAPDQDYMCTKRETMNMSEAYSAFQEVPSYPFRMGLYPRGTVIIGKG